MIFNLTKQKLISEKERPCRSVFSQISGLMFRKKQNLIMIFPQERKISLHNCFVFYLIDVLVIGEKAAGDTKNTSRKEILEIKRHFRPFTFWNSSQKGKYLVELGFPGDYDVGDMIEIK